MATRELVGYDYIAAGLGLLRTKAVREYKHRHNDFPTAVNPGHATPLFGRVDADRYIHAHRRPSAPELPMPAPIKLDLDKVVDHTYIADQLRVSLRTVYQYAAGAQRAPGFPEPIALPGVRSALFKRVDADAFISSRRHNASDQKGRLRAGAIDTTALAASEKAAEVLGREVDLEDLAQLRPILFEELSLPATRSTSRGLSVATPDLVALQEAHPHPFLHQVLVYRGAIV